MHERLANIMEYVKYYQHNRHLQNMLANWQTLFEHISPRKQKKHQQRQRQQQHHTQNTRRAWFGDPQEDDAEVRKALIG